MLKAVQGPTLTSLHLGSHLRPIDFLQVLECELTSWYPNLRQLRIGDLSINFRAARPNEAEMITEDGFVRLLTKLPQLTSLSVSGAFPQSFHHHPIQGGSHGPLAVINSPYQEI